MDKAYEREVLDRALASEDGLRIRGPKGKLYSLRHRLHALRVVDRQLSTKVYEASDPKYGHSEYDKLSIRNPVPDGDLWVLVIDNTQKDFRDLEIIG